MTVIDLTLICSNWYDKSKKVILVSREITADVNVAGTFSHLEIICTQKIFSHLKIIFHRSARIIWYYAVYQLDFQHFLWFAGPPFVHPIPELKAVVGREFRVVCPASGYPLDKITWSKGKNSLTQISTVIKLL